MNIVEYLHNHGIALPRLVAEIGAAVGIASDDVLLAAGSLVEGLGNAKSDIDLVLLTSRNDIAFSSLDCVALLFGNCLIDIKVIQHAEVDALLHRFADWAAQPRQPRNAMDFTYDDRIVLHRLWSGMVLHGEARFEALHRGLNRATLAQHKLDCARFMASTLQIDLAGFSLAGDALSMPFAAQDLLGYTADALLAGFGLLSPNPKWRARLLERIPASWREEMPGRPADLSAVRTFVTLHRAPGDISVANAFEHAVRIVGFSRAVFPWMEYRLLGGTEAIPWQLPAARADENASGRRLPVLGLDVQVSYRDGRFELWRLNEPDTVHAVSPLAYSVVCLCDGATLEGEALDWVARLVGARQAETIVDEVLSTLRYGRFEAEKPIDEAALTAILGRSAATA
jgi:hypothetical protein